MIHVVDVIHQSGPDPLHPIWDTMPVLRNTLNQAVNATLTIYSEKDGSIVQWPDSGKSVTVTLEPNQTWPVSFIPGNGFPNPPQDFKGHMEIDCRLATPFAEDANDSVFAFVLIANKWASGVNVPTRKDNIAAPLIGPKQLWRFVYAIPRFDDTKGATARFWVTGVSIQNLDLVDHQVTLTYTVAQTYAQKSQQYQTTFRVPANGGVRFDMILGNPDQNVPGLAGYPLDLNSEGFVDITTEEPAILEPSIIIADAAYSFMVSEEPF